MTVNKIVTSNERFLGKKPARAGAIKVMLEDHVDVKELVARIPERFGHQGLIGASGWGMLANDKVGDCLCAGFLHHIMLWNRMAGKTVKFADKDAIKVYRQMGGYDPSKTDAHGENPTDQGCDMEASFKKWRQDGVLGHELDSYVGLKPGDLDQLLVGLYYANAVGLGWVWTRRMMDDFNAGAPIDYHSHDQEEGGHYTAGVGKGSIPQTVTWGKVAGFTPRCYARRSDEAAALFSLEMLKDGKSIDGFDKGSILKALADATAKGSMPIKAEV